jgi:hypothetical protein
VDSLEELQVLFLKIVSKIPANRGGNPVNAVHIVISSVDSSMCDDALSLALSKILSLHIEEFKSRCILRLTFFVGRTIINNAAVADTGSSSPSLMPVLFTFMLASFLSGVLLIGPKFMGAALVLSRPAERRAFGGRRAIAKGMAAEIALSAILAPILMVANTKAFIQILSGHDTGWTTQQREADGLAWSDAFRAMRWQMVAGVGFIAPLCVRPDLATWFAPIVLPLLLAAPIAVWTSRVRSGDALAKKGFLVTPAQDGVSVNPSVLHTPRSPLRAVAGGVLAPVAAPAMVPARAPEL